LREPPDPACPPTLAGALASAFPNLSFSKPAKFHEMPEMTEIQVELMAALRLNQIVSLDGDDPDEIQTMYR